MQAIVLDKPGSPIDWRLADVPLPSPASGEVRIRVHAVGLNPADYKIAEWGNPAWTYPFIMGLDVAGVIDAIGPDVVDWQVGDPVYYHGDFTRPGGFAEYTVTTAHTIAPLPDGLTFAEAASVPCAGFAAYQGLLIKTQVKQGDVVFVQGGAGGVGSYAIQLSAYAGATVITTASPQNHDYVRGLGADHVIDYNTDNVLERVSELTHGRGPDIILDAVSQATTTTALDMIAFGGHIIGVDSLPDFAAVKPFAKAFSLHEIALGVAHLSGDRKAQEQLAQIGREMGQLLADGAIKPALTRTISLQEVPQGMQELAGRHVRGKIVAQLVASDS